MIPRLVTTPHIICAEFASPASTLCYTVQSRKYQSPTCNDWTIRILVQQHIWIMTRIRTWTRKQNTIRYRNMIFFSANSSCAIVAHILTATSPQQNALGAKIPVSSQLSNSVWRHYLRDYADQDVVEFVQFGWPIDYISSVLPQSTHTNHSSALAHHMLLILSAQMANALVVHLKE